MGVQREFFLEEDEQGRCIRSNIIEIDSKSKSILRVFPVDQYEFPEEIKRQAKEWRVLKIPLLGQRVIEEEDSDWCGRTSASMVYNYYQLIKGGDQRQRYITHSRAGDPECRLDLRYPRGERAFFGIPADESYKRGWTTYPKASYEVGGDCSLFHSDPNGEVPLPLELIFPSKGARPTGLGGILRYRTPSTTEAEIGNLLPQPLRHEVDEIKGSESRIRERFAHIIDCLRANNPVVIYTGIGFWNKKLSRNPLHIIVIIGYCILRVGAEEQLWLVTADPSSKFSLVNQGLLSAPNTRGSLDLGARLGPAHVLFRMRAGISLGDDMKGFASFNLVRAKTFFEKNPEIKGSVYDRFLDHSQTPCGRYIYREVRTNAPPEVVDSSFNRPRYSFPLRGNTVSTSPWQGYHNNESLDTGIGGYYVLGLQRNLHGGVHFFPPAEQKLAPVNAAAPGYVVAARLPGDKAPCLQDGVLEAFGNWPGFVLVRHALEEVVPSGSQARPRQGTFYSLYMHLSSPVFPPGVADKPSQKPSLLDNYFSQVPWFRELYKRRFGAWVNISGQGAEPGTLRWAQEPVPPSEQEPPKAGGAKRVCKVLADNLSLEDITVCDNEGQVHWLYKAPPANLKAALAALEQGQVITFAEPFFPVEAGEILGFLRPLPGHSAILHGHLKDFENERNAPESARKSKEMKVDAGFMHFQVFSPEDAPDNGIKLLVELAEKLDTGGSGKPRFVELKEDTQDNFLELEEIKNHLTTTLPSEDQADFNKATHQHFAQSSQSDDGGFGYGPAVANFLDQNTSFAPQAKAPAWESCHRFNYPLTLEIELVHLPPPDKNSMVSGGSYELELLFERANGDDWKPMPRPLKGCDCGPFAGSSAGCKPAILAINAKKLGEAKDGVLSFSLMVPALAERMRLKAASGFVIDQTMSLPGADGRMFVEGITRRWRNVRLIQKNEWVPENARKVLKKLIAALEEQGQQHPKEEDVSQVAWCDPAKEAHIPRIIEGEEKASTPLFSDSGPLAPGHLPTSVA